MGWRWDQGRLDYFRYDNIVSQARALSGLDGMQLGVQGRDPLRAPLSALTGLPFAPSHYSVWRNYGRVFSCALLATSIGGRLAVTDVCKRIAHESHAFSADDYLSLFVRRFSYPFPAFQGYNTHARQVFPLCAVLKTLLGKRMTNREPTLRLEEVFSHIIGNSCSGEETLDHYASLSPTRRIPRGDENRQVREILIFASQLSFLKWHANRLFLDLDWNDNESLSCLFGLATPVALPRASSPNEQILRLGTLAADGVLSPPLHAREVPGDVLFTEGRRVRVTHLRSERSPRLRDMYFHAKTPPFLCDMCAANLGVRYPWTENLLEIHHVCPLGSSVSITTRGTSLNDVEPLCPNCHRSIHAFYGDFLKSNKRDDFGSRDEARLVYSNAKRLIRL